MHDSKIFLIQCECQYISVYEASKPYSFLHKIIVCDMINPSDLLKFDGCLYIPDNMTPGKCRLSGINLDIDHCIWKIQLSGTVNSEKMLTLLGKWWPWSLSITSDGRQIIIGTTTEKAYFWSPVTNEVQVVTLPADVKCCQHILELSSGSYMLCHDPWPSSGLKKVCRLVRSGDKMNFAEISCDTDGLYIPTDKDDLHKPERLVELPDGTILVVDNHNNCLLVMDKDLKSQKVLLCLKTGGKKRPCRIAYDSCLGLLLVAFHHSAGLYFLHVDANGALTSTSSPHLQ